MSISRKFIHLMLVLPLLVGAASVSAAPPPSTTHFTVHLEDVTIPWVFPPPDGLSSFCSKIPRDVHINPDDLGSDRIKHATHVVRPNGSERVVVSDLISGTASDNFGRAYDFLYINTVTLKFDGVTVLTQMKDFFNLKGGDINYTVGFNWRWAYLADNLEITEVLDQNGEAVDIAIDPFFFATNDGVNEDPNIIPGSWQQLSTRGDPWNCDPL